MNNQMPGKIKCFAIFLQGFLSGVLGLSAFYYLLLFAITGDPKHPFSQFMLFQPWMTLLTIGFGLQIGLFWLLRKGIHFSIRQKHDAQFTAGAGGAVSGVAMVACCAHHMVDLLPVLGLSAAVIFLSEYQQELLIFGLFSNLIGILMMLWFITGKEKPIVLVKYLCTKLRSLV